jgi:prepilin-type N-terminal cleavage/methylation domain-containing protein
MQASQCPHRSVAGSRNAGFSLIELMVVIAIMMVMTAISTPPILAAIAHTKLRGAASNLSGFIQSSRMQAVKRNITVTVQFATTGDVPIAVMKDVNDTSDVSVTDPQVQLGPSSMQLAAPDGDASPLTDTVLSYTPLNLPDLISFNSRGLPCKYAAGVCTPSGFVYYLTDTRNPGTWVAVSISPGGRVKQWFWNGTVWGD